MSIQVVLQSRWSACSQRPSCEAELVQREAVDLMEALGVQYEKEHEKDLKGTMYYMPEHFGNDVYGSGEDALPLPPPFTTRPRLGARVLVTNNFTRLVNPIIGEMSSWQLELRTKVGPDGCCAPRHKIPIDLRSNGAKCVG